MGICDSMNKLLSHMRYTIAIIVVQTKLPGRHLEIIYILLYHPRPELTAVFHYDHGVIGNLHI